MEPFVARSEPGRSALLILGCFCFVGLGVWLAGLLGEPPRAGGEWIGWLQILVFAPIGALWIVRFFDDAVQVLITTQGIYSKAWSDQTIPWTEITDVSVWEYQSNKTILLHLRDPAQFPATSIVGKLAPLNRAFTGGDISLNLTGMDRSFDQAMSAIERFRNPLEGVKN